MRGPGGPEKLAMVEPDGTMNGCELDGEWLSVEIGPFTLGWDTDCPKQGYNDSGSHGYGCDCDHWVSIVETEVKVMK